MSQIAVVYKSKYGSTKQYAQWISEELDADIFSVEEAGKVSFSRYDTIIFGGCINAGGIKGIEFLKKNIKAFSGKRILTFAVGLNVDNEKNMQDCREINFVKKLADIPCFFLPGAYNPAKVSGFDRKLMGVVKKMVSGNADSDPAAKALVDAIENGADLVDRERLAPLLEAVKNHIQDI